EKMVQDKNSLEITDDGKVLHTHRGIISYHQPALLPKGKIIFSFTEVVFLEQTGTYYGTCQKVAYMICYFANKLDALGIFIFFFLFAWVFLCPAVQITNGWLVISIAKFTLSAISAEGISRTKWDVIVFT
ncbi:hypothetical protein ACJX0J_015564, partial [Zea mays]